MNNNEIRKAKKELERSITDQLKQFETNYDVRVSSIDSFFANLSTMEITQPDRFQYLTFRIEI